jgi:hypothetical protein
MIFMANLWVILSRQKIAATHIDLSGLNLISFPSTGQLFLLPLDLRIPLVFLCVAKC